MGDFGILIIGVVDTFFAFFVVAPMMLQAASLFGVQKQFAKAMVQEGVVTQEAVDRIHPKKQIAGVVISLLLLAVLAFVLWNAAWVTDRCEEWTAALDEAEAALAQGGSGQQQLDALNALWQEHLQGRDGREKVQQVRGNALLSE